MAPDIRIKVLDGLEQLTKAVGALAQRAFCPTGQGGGVDPSCGSGGGGPKEQVSAVREAVIQKVREYTETHGSWEMLTFVDKKTGDVFEQEGSAGHVNVSPENIKRLESSDYSLDAIHNHPSGGSLSGQDIAMLRYPGMAAVTAVTSESVYSASRGPGYNEKKILSQYKSTYDREREKLLQRRDRRELTDAQVGSLIDHVTMQALAKKGYIQYSQVKSE